MLIIDRPLAFPGSAIPNGKLITREFTRIDTVRFSPPDRSGLLSPRPLELEDLRIQLPSLAELEFVFL